MMEKETTVEEADLKFQMPFRMLVCGSTGVGKSTFVLKLLKNRNEMFSHNFSSIIYSYPENISPDHNDFIVKLKNVCDELELCPGLPDFNQLGFRTGHKLVVLDDQILKIVNNADIFHAVTIASNHLNISIIITSQNLYVQGKYSKTLLRNMSDKIMFRDKGDGQWLSTFSRQMFPHHPDFLTNVMDFIVDNFPSVYDHYIVIDNNPKSRLDKSMLIRTHIFPNVDGEIEPIFFDCNV
jgi:septin family protein